MNTCVYIGCIALVYKMHFFFCLGEHPFLPYGHPSWWLLKSLIPGFVFALSLYFGAIQHTQYDMGHPLLPSIPTVIEIFNRTWGMRPRASTHWWDAWPSWIVKFDDRSPDGFAQKIEQLNLCSIYAGVSTQARNLIKSSGSFINPK